MRIRVVAGICFLLVGRNFFVDQFDHRWLGRTDSRAGVLGSLERLANFRDFSAIDRIREKVWRGGNGKSGGEEDGVEASLVYRLLVASANFRWIDRAGVNAARGGSWRMRRVGIDEQHCVVRERL